MVEEAANKVPRKIGARSAAAIVLLAGLIAAGLYVWKIMRPGALLSNSPGRVDSSTAAVVASPYQLAVAQVEQERGEATGNQARVDIPAELKLYADKRRFLAVQVAEWRAEKYDIPDDFAELAAMVEKGELTRLAPVGDGYILYGVGLKADDILTHYDQKSGASLPLFSDETALRIELGRLADALKELDLSLRDSMTELARTGTGDREARAALRAQIAAGRKSAAAMRTSREKLAAFCTSREHRQLLFAEYAELAELARDFDGQVFDLNDPDSRKEFKMRLLSYLRLPARARLEEIGSLYQQKFARPLPITSLIRTREYQRYLGSSGNPNATRIEVPPHATGLAFDIYTYYMSAGEQQFLMAEIARLKREGRVEALREKRHHIHVFAFADGQPPRESLVRETLRQAAAWGGAPE